MDRFKQPESAGEEYVDIGFASFAAIAMGLQKIALEATEYSGGAVEAGRAAIEEMASARSLESAYDVQMRYARTAHEALVASVARMSGLYADLARDAYKPFEQAVRAR